MGFCDFWARFELPPLSAERDLIDRFDGWMMIKDLINGVTNFFETVALTAKLKALMAEPFQNSCPFCSFQRDSISTCKACRNKPDSP